MIIRTIQPSEYGFLDKMLYQAIFLPVGMPKLPENIVYEPFFVHYIEDFGKKTDFCYVAEDNNELLGAVWTRLFDENNPGYGFINAETPELSIAIDENHRNKGIGTRLLSAIFEALRKANYTQISLSVDSRNLAYPLYLKLGFVEYSTDEYSVKMVKTL